MMKKLIFTLLITLFSPQVFALEDYIILSDNPVETVSSSNENVAIAKPLYSIDNNKNIILLKAKNIGQTFIAIETTKNKFNININVEEDKTTLCETEGFTYYTLDIPDDKPIIRGN